VVHRRQFATRDRARSQILEYIEIFHHRQRVHSALDYHSPVLTLNTMPLFKLPPARVVPYSAPPDNTKSDRGSAPSLPVKYLTMEYVAAVTRSGSTKPSRAVSAGWRSRWVMLFLIGRLVMNGSVLAARSVG
jgi:hypothetical protein